MRRLIAVVIVGSIVVLVALLGKFGTREDDLARSIATMVEKSR